MLKGAVIGFGKIATTGHMPAYCTKEISEKAEIIAAVEPNINTAEEQKAAYPKIKFYNSMDVMLENEAVDFIDICTPPKFHVDAIEKAAAKGISIICEKPLAIYISEAAKIYRKIHSEGLVFSACHQYKYSSVWKEFKVFMDALPPAEKIFLQFNVYRTRPDTGYFDADPEWRANKDISGGGILSDTGVHYLYLANWLMGNPRSVFTKNANLSGKLLNVEDSSFTIIEYARGIAQINLTWGANARENYARAVSPNASLLYARDKLYKNIAGVSEETNISDVSDKSAYINMYRDLFLEFLDKVRKNDKNLQSLTEAFETITLLDSCYRSSLCNKVEQL
jgi:predicted dehydrogenase